MNRIIALLIVLCNTLPGILSSFAGIPVLLSEDSCESAEIVETYHYPCISPGADGFTFMANNKEVFVYQTSAGPFAAFSCSGTVNIDVTVSRYNPGYSVSFIGGYDNNHTVERITFDNFILGGSKVSNGDQLDLFTKQAKDIIFK